MRFNKDKIVILLGAGCSVEAGIPSSLMMINEIEALISGEDKTEEDKIKWDDYKELYSLIKSSITYSYGLNNKFSKNANFNIEKLVDTLSELEKGKGHYLYPFIEQWNKELIEYGGERFEKIRELKNHIVNKLRTWVTIKDYSKASYYSKFVEFKNEYSHPLRIFSLNYDLCLDKHIGKANLETGFESTEKWAWRKFEEIENVTTTDIYLYKMHGSINWERDEQFNLMYSDEIVKVKSPELIFGTSYKMQYTDPYLFFATEFRKFTLDAQLIITIGYAFGDEHINSMLKGAARSNPALKILCVVLNADERHIRKELNPIASDQVIIRDMKAKEFIENELKIDKLENILPPEEGIFPS